MSVAVDGVEALAYSFPDMSARDWAVGSLDAIVKLAWLQVGMQPLRDLATVVWYADWRRDQMKRDSPRRKPVDVDDLVKKWVEVVVGLSTTHSHADYTASDYRTDELLGPLLTAPIAQIRQFGQRLAAALEADHRIPFLVWSSFKRMIEPVILKGPDGELLSLKKDLAARVADAVEKNLDRGQLVEAIAGALQWRSGERLEAVKQRLDAGEKPRIRGRESCLFLEAGEEVVVL